RLPQGRGQVPRVNDRLVHAARVLPPAADVKLAWAVAPLAADRHLPERRVAVAVDGVLDRVGLLGVAEQAPGLDPPGEVGLPLVVPGGQLPPRLLAGPGERR